MVLVEEAAQLPGRVPRAPGSGAGKAIKLAANQVPQRVTGKRIEAEKHHVGQHDDRAQPDIKAALIAKSANGVIPEEAKKDEGNIKSVTVQVLQNKREAGFTTIIAGFFAHGTGWRIKKEGAVISLAIVITGCAKAQRPSQNQEGGRKGPPVVSGIDERRIKR